MSTLVHTLAAYLQETFGTTVAPVPWVKSQLLPFYLQDGYLFYRVDLLGVASLLMLDQNRQEQTPATVRKHLDHVHVLWADPIIYVRGRISSYNRKRLMAQRVPFVVPRNQMYLPMLGMDLRDHFRAQRTTPTTFSPSTQAVFLHCLLADAERTFVPGELANVLGYSAMTMTRAFDELENAGVGEFSRRGRERHACFGPGREEAWRKSQAFLRSPVRKRYCIRTSTPEPVMPRAGLTALAHYSMLAAPATPVSAVSQGEWRRLRRIEGTEEVPFPGPDVTEVEAWWYDPGLLADNATVDRLSLYLSLREEDDERVQSALAEMMRAMAW